MSIKIQKNILLAQYTTLKIGGAARFFCEAKNEEEIQEAVKFAGEKKLPVFILGGGSNILVSDKGFGGLVIRILNSQFSILNSRINCGAGILLSKIVSESVKSGLTGLEWAAGIPGTVGGAVWGNAGAFNGSMGEIVESVRALEILNTKSEALNNLKSQISNLKSNPNSKNSNTKYNIQYTIYNKRDCQFSYRDSVFKQNPNLIILSAILKLKKGDKAESEKKVKEILAERKEKQPFDFPSSGSFFKNPCLAGRRAETKSQKLLEEFEKNIGDKAIKDVIPAGYLSGRVGLRGKKIGGATVSQRHGNFLVNAGKAKAEDFIILAAIIKTRVRNKFGIQLKEEVQMVGF